MRKTIAILFLFIFLCADTEAGQLLKLPYLVHHYWEHRAAEHGMGFIPFLKKHYSGPHHQAAKAKHHHQKLPFKMLDGCSLNTIVALVPEPSFTLYTASGSSIQDHASYTEPSYTSRSWSRIWQPPK